MDGLAYCDIFGDYPLNFFAPPSHQFADFQFCGSQQPYVAAVIPELKLTRQDSHFIC